MFLVTGKMEESQAQELQTASQEAPLPIKRRVFKKIMVLLSILLVLFVCVMIMIFVIPRTNIYRLEDRLQERINQYLPSK